MNYYHITGTSRGIGKAIAEELLKQENSIVIGFSRKQTITHERYRHITLDLNMIEAVREYQFEQYNDAEQIVLINNSGVLGEVNYIGKISSRQIVESHNVNFLSPSILINSFIKSYTNKNVSKVIINVSSGAAKHVVKSWSSYCATKAGLEMYARVLHEEILEAERNDVKVYSIAPGIIDTEMQAEIRAVPDENFSAKSKFVELKKNNRLVSAEEVARKMVDVIENSQKYSNPLMDFRD